MVLGDGVRGRSNSGRRGHCGFSGIVGGRYCFVDFSATATGQQTVSEAVCGRKNCEIRTQEATEQLLFGIFYDIGFFDCVLTWTGRRKT